MTTPNGRTGMQPVTVRQATIDLLRTHRLTTWFGNPGSSELTLLEHFPSDFRYMLGLQEMVPVGMADAYAQITGRPAIVNLHTAPGMGNAQGALYNAYINKTPLIVTAGNQRRDLQNQMCLLTNVEATNVPKPFVKWSAEPAIASEVPAVLARAIHIANTAQGWCSSHFPWTTCLLNSPISNFRTSTWSVPGLSPTPADSPTTWPPTSLAASATQSRRRSSSAATSNASAPGTRSSRWPNVPSPSC